MPRSVDNVGPDVLIERAENRTIRLDEGADTFLIGRDAERALIGKAFSASVSQSRCHGVLLLAEPGLGKSLLASDTIARLGTYAETALTVCQEWAEGSLAPLERLVQAVAPGVKDDPEAALKDLVPIDEERVAIAEQLCRLFGWGDAPEVPDVSSWSVRRLLENVSTQTPLVLVFEDLHSAEDPLLDTLEDLMIRLVGPITFLLTGHPDVVVRRPTLGLPRENFHVRRLEALGRETALKLAEDVLGGQIVRGPWLENLLATANGNPLFLVEALVQLRDDGHLQREDGAWKARSVADVSTSSTMHSLLGTRVASLSREERVVLEAAAAWSVDFDVDQLKGLLPDRESSDVLSCLADLRSSGFIEDSSTAAGSSTFRIRNALLREAAYLQCKKERLAELHERAAAYAEVQGYGPDFMGYHLERAFRLRKEAVPDDPRNGSVAEKAANHLHAAGRGERARGATTSAADLFRRALDLRLVLGPAWFDDSIELTDCLLDLARTREALEMVKLIQETAPQLGDAVVSARADLMKVFAKSLTSTDPTIEKSFRELLPIFEAQGDHRTLVKIYRGLSEFYWNLFECGASASAAESALQHSLETPEKFELAHIVSAVSYGLIWGPAPVSEAMAAGERLLTISVGNLVSLAQLKLKLGLLDAFAGNFDAARKRAESGLRELRELGQERFAAIRTHDVGIVQMMAGELTTAYETFLAGYNELTRLDMIDYRATSAAYLARIDYELGRAEQALKYLAIAEETAEEDPWIEPDTLPLRAQMAADAGERDRALKFIGAARALADGKDSTVIQATIEILTARALRTLGMEEKAAEAQAKAEALCKKKEAPALLALADPTSMKS